MPGQQMRGVFPILLTPFDEHDRIDEDGLRSVVEYAIRSGVHGVGIALGSEMPKLVESERDLVVRTVIDQARGRVPVVGQHRCPGELPGGCVQSAGRGAGRVGGDVHPSGRGLGQRDPVLLQGHLRRGQRSGLHPGRRDGVGLGGADSPDGRGERAGALREDREPAAAGQGRRRRGEEQGAGDDIRRRQRDVPDRRASPRVGRDDALPDSDAGVRGGVGRFQAGDLDGARDVFDREILPLLRVSSTGVRLGHLVHKEVLRRQGVIKCAKVRAPADLLDDQTKRELDEVLDRLGIG